MTGNATQNRKGGVESASIIVRGDCVEIDFPGGEYALQREILCTEYGLILCENSISTLNTSSASASVSRVSEKDSFFVELDEYDSPFVSTREMPIAVQFAIIFRGLLKKNFSLDARYELVIECDCKDERKLRLDLGRAAAMADLKFNDCPIADFDNELSAIVQMWRENIAWAPMQISVMGGALEQVLEGRFPLQATIGLADQVASKKEVTKQLIVDVRLGKEEKRVCFDWDRSDPSFPLQIDVDWLSDGILVLDLTVNQEWHPVPAIKLADWQSDSNKKSTREYLSLSYWQRFVEDVRVDVFSNTNELL